MRNIEWIMKLAQELTPYFLNYKPRSHSMAEILGGIIWVLVSGSQWSLIPKDSFPPKSTCYYWFKKFKEDNTIENILESLNFCKKEIIEEAYIDATFTEAKQGGEKVGKTKAGKGSKVFAVVARNKDVLHLSIENATPHETSFVPKIIKKIKGKIRILNLIGDKAYDSFPLKNEVKKHGTRLIAPDRKNRIHNKEDGRRLRRYKRRYKVENFFADLHTYRRLVTRYEKNPQNHLTFLQLATLAIKVTKYKFNKGMVARNYVG